jgi:glutathionylspermidine synthase
MARVAIEVRCIGPGDPLSNPVIARDLTDRYLLFDAYVGGTRRVELQPLVLSRDLHEAAVLAAEGVVAAVGRVAARSHVDPVERAHYRLGDGVTRLASASYEAGDHASLMRVDLLLAEDGVWRACEINADCPGGHNESLALPRLARTAGFRQGVDPTRMLEALVSRIGDLSAQPDSVPGVVALLYATAYAEDLQVCAVVRRALERQGVRALLVSPTTPRFADGELRIDGEVVRVLYRYFPTEYMEGQSNLEGIIQAVRERRVRSLSSFAHIYTQSKLSLARAWTHQPGMAQRDRDIVRRHVPPSFDVADVPRARLVAEQGQWVLKRAYGRVGDEVLVGPLFASADWGIAVDAVHTMRAAGESWVAQRFVPQRAVQTPWGPRYVTLGAYVLDGRFVGYFARITPDSHVSHEALCVPVFTESA